MQGYGYQFWCTQNQGYVCYGMGGQLMLVLPEKEMILITTADTQSRQGGVQLIYDAFWQEIYQKISDQAIAENPESLLQTPLAAIRYPYGSIFPIRFFPIPKEIFPSPFFP